RTSTRGGTSSASSSDVAGCCGGDGAPSPPTIGATFTRGGTSTIDASCRSFATRSSIPPGRSDRAERSGGGRESDPSGDEPHRTEPHHPWTIQAGTRRRRPPCLLWVVVQLGAAIGQFTF